MSNTPSLPPPVTSSFLFNLGNSGVPIVPSDLGLFLPDLHLQIRDDRQSGDGSSSSSCATLVPTPTLNFGDLGFPNFAGQLAPLNPSQSFSAYSTPQGGGLLPQSMGVSAQPRRQGGRRPKELDMYEQDNMDGDDYDKKVKRRQRNKEAAARCRQRRLQLMGELQDKVDTYKKDNYNKAEEIKKLRAQMERYETMIRSHNCKLPPTERQKVEGSVGGFHKINLLSQHMASSSHGHGHMGPPPLSMALPPVSMANVSHMTQIENTFPAQIRPAMKQRDSTDYVPQMQQMQEGRKRTHAPSMVTHHYSDVPHKMVKTEPDDDISEKTLSQINTTKDDVDRPQQLILDAAISGNGPIPIATPSRDTYGNAPTFGMGSFPAISFGVSGGDPGNILNCPTGLTPVVQPNNVSVFPSNSITPLPNNQELKSL